MTNYLDSLSSFELALFYIAIPVTIIFLIMTVLTFIADFDGGDIDVDTDVDSDVEGDDSPTFQFFTLRNLIAVLLGLSWGGLALGDSFESELLISVLGLCIGIGIALIQSSLFFLMNKLRYEPKVNYSSVIGKNAMVYLRIPKKGNGMGKIGITINGKFYTMSAITNDPKDFPSHSQVRIKSLVDDTFVVEEIK